MSQQNETTLTIHAGSQIVRQLIADLLYCFDFDEPEIDDNGDLGLKLVQEYCGYEENLLPALHEITRLFDENNLSETGFSIDGHTDCDYGVFCVFEIEHKNGKTRCRDADVDFNDEGEEEYPDDTYPDGFTVFLMQTSGLKELDWIELEQHSAIQDPWRDAYDENAVQNAENVIAEYLSE